MRYELKGNWFYFDKELLEHVVPLVSYGVVKEFGDFMVLEPLPEVLYKNEYNVIIMDCKVVDWDDMIYYTKDRLKGLTGEKKVLDSVEVLNFYAKKYNEEEIENQIKKIEGVESVSYYESDLHWFGFDVETMC